jgi:hypothetical protein
MFDFSLRLRSITRRALLGGIALLTLGRAGAGAALSETPLVAATIALVTAADLLSLGPPQMLQRLAFRGGKPVKTERPDGAAVYDIRDGVLTYGHVELTKRGEAWQLGTLSVLFSPDEKIPLAAFRAALTPKFGEPADRTTGNTVLVWTATDRVIRVTADPPGDPAMLVYALTIAPH